MNAKVQSFKGHTRLRKSLES